MRAMGKKNGIWLKAYAGTTGVLLAMNVTKAKREGLLGFAIERSGPYNNRRWLRGLLRFDPPKGKTLTPIATKKAPIQKFRWSDYSVYPTTYYHYRVHGAYGNPGKLRLLTGGEVSVRTESISEGEHKVIFNRAAAASQAYQRRFKGVNPDLPENEAARRWLSRGLREKILAFLERATCKNWALDMAIYEIELDDVVDSLLEARKRGADVRIVYHAKKKRDKQTRDNEKCLKRLPKSAKTARKTSSIFHQKFVVLSYVGSDGTKFPVSVLTGTTNFTGNGVYRQANMVHVVDNPQLATEYHDLFNFLFNGGDARQTKKYINKNDPITDARLQVIFSPRKGFGDTQKVSSILSKARHNLIFCTAFVLHPDIQKALVPEQPDNVVRYGLQNRKKFIRGVHRIEKFTVPACLNKGLEYFLKESFAKQKGGIFIHLKTMITDFTTKRPIIITGSNNFSKAASRSNDENMLILCREPSVADTYVTEMMRLYDHYRFRYNQKEKSGRGVKKRLTLVEDNTWTNRYFVEGSPQATEREMFCK